MTKDTLTDIDHVEQELAELQAELAKSLPLLAKLNEIPRQFAGLAAECAVMEQAITAAEQANDAFTATRQAQEARFAALAAEQADHRQQLAAAWAAFRTDAIGRQELQAKAWDDFCVEDTAHRKQRAEEWQAFRTAIEAEQNTVMRLAMTTRQELTDRVAAQEALVKSLNERLAALNEALANMGDDLQATRRRQKTTALLLSGLVLLSAGLSAAVAWTVFF
jgi:DNA repair exonuclease SbcCD ATPase subunit